MSLGAANFLRNATMLEQLLEEINFQRTKEMRQLLKDESGFVVLQGTTQWTDLFVRHFLFQEEQAIDCDDLLFFVRKRHVKGSSRYLPKYETDVEVFRKDSKKLPIGDPEIDWEETVYLNLVVHQFDYTLTLAICTRTSPKELQVLKRHSQKVYASPSRRQMDTKGEGEQMTYPHICFMVDNFDEVFCDIVVRDGEMVCVELVARGRGGTAQTVIFLGSIRYDALTRVYESRQTSLSTKVAARMSFGLLGGAAAARCEFVRMRGPGGKGHAEVAVSRPRCSGLDTPASEPGLPADQLWDSDWEDDPEDMLIYKHQRRLSDPSANLNNFSRGNWRAKDTRDKSRSENEGLDELGSGLAEVEAGDLRDEAAASSAPRTMRALCGPPAAAPAVDFSSPACLRRRPPAPALPAPPCELARDAAQLEEGPGAAAAPRPARRPGPREVVRGREEHPPAWGAAGPDRPPRKQPHLRALHADAPRTAKQKLCTKIHVGKTAKKDAPEAKIQEKTESKICTDSAAFISTRSTKSAETGKEDPPMARFATLPRRRGGGGAGGGGAEGAAAGRLRHRRAADGTLVYYWCELPAATRRLLELDDGLCRPLWASRGFSQTFQLWKEGRRQQSPPLSAGLTYVTLPWWTIAKDILDHREEPILTF